jgi:hypothetical protein
MTTIWKTVTYPELTSMYDYYTWNSTLGNVGGFSYKKNNIVTDKPIAVKNIGQIENCKSDVNYSFKNEVLGLSKTTVELPFVPKNTNYGWCDKSNCWVYFTDNNVDKPTHFSSYIM